MDKGKEIEDRTSDVSVLTKIVNSEIAKKGSSKVKWKWRTLSRRGRVIMGWLVFAARIPFVTALEIGEDFSNNLFSDLAPLLTLFGEQVAKQFMAGSTTWEDHILFAMGPLGIITAVVGAIRIGGPLWLRAIIGRARESQATAEDELTTSTSQDVCEIWNGRSVVRLVGSPRILQLVYLELDEKDPKTEPYERILTLESGTQDGLKFEKVADREKTLNIFSCIHQWIIPPSVATGGPRGEGDAGQQTMENDETNPSAVIAPNLFLNLRPQISSKEKWELRAFAAIGTLLQSGVLVFSAFATYHPKLSYEKEGQKVEPYGYPLAAAGTVILVFGMWICSLVVEKSTTEEIWVVQRHGGDKTSTIPLRLVWLQQGGAVTDQQFDSYAIFANEKRESILTSRLSTRFGGIRQASDSSKDQKDKAGSHQHYSTCKSAKSSQMDPSKLLQGIVTVGTAISIIGFIAQFTGLRFLHFSATVAQLAITLIMAAIRAWVRRGLAFTPSAFKIPQGFELDWLAPRLLEPGQLWPAQSAECSCGISDGSCRGWGIKAGASETAYNFYSLPLPGTTSHAHKAMKLRERIGQLSKWTGPVSAAAIALSSTIEVVMDSLFQKPEYTDMAWTMQGLETPNEHGTLDSGLIFLSIRRLKTGWRSSATEIEALLSLWLFSIHSRQKSGPASTENENGDGDWLRQGDAALTTPAVHLIGATNQSSFLLRDLRCYLGDAFEQLHTIQIASTEDVIESEVKNIVDASLIFSSGDCGTLALDFLTASKSMRDVKLEIGRDFRMNLDCVVGTIRETSAEKHLIQAMFSAFFWAVARKMEKMGGKTTVTPCTPSTTTNTESSAPVVIADRFHLDNKNVSKLTDDIQRAAGEWLGDRAQVLWCIIPQLSKMFKLPEAAEVIEHYRELARPAEATGNHREAVRIYGGLAEYFSTASIRAYDYMTTSKAVGVIFNLYYRLVSDFIPGLEEDANFSATVSTQQLSRDSEMHFSSIQRLLPDFNVSTLIQDLEVLYHLRNQRFPSILESQITSLVEKRFRSHPEGFFGATTMHRKALERVREGVSLSKKYNSPFDMNFFEASGDLLKSSQEDSLGLTPWHYCVLECMRSLRQYLDSLHTYNYIVDVICCLITPSALPLGLDSSGWGCFHYLSMLMDFSLVQHPKSRNSDKLLKKLGGVLDIPLNLKGELNSQDLSGFTPLHYARTEYFASFLIRNGAELDRVGRCGSTALHMAAKRGIEEMAILFLNCGANPNAVDRRGRTPLHWAAYYGYVGICRMLKERGAILSVRDIKGRLPLHLTRASHFLDEELWNILSGPQDENLLATDLEGRNILHIGAAADTLHPNSIALLVEKYNAQKRLALVTDPTEREVQPHTELIDILDGSGKWTAVAIAAARGNTSAISLLVDYGRETRPLDLAVGTPSPLCEPARKCHSCSRLSVAIYVAVKYGHESVIQILLDRYGPDTAFILNDTAPVELIIDDWSLQWYFETEPDDELYDTPLNVAIRRGDENIVRILLDRGSDVRYVPLAAYHLAEKFLQRYFQTALSWALREFRTSILEMLIDHWEKSRCKLTSAESSNLDNSNYWGMDESLSRLIMVKFPIHLAVRVSFELTYRNGSASDEAIMTLRLLLSRRDLFKVDTGISPTDSDNGYPFSAGMTPLCCILGQELGLELEWCLTEISMGLTGPDDATQAWEALSDCGCTNIGFRHRDLGFLPIAERFRLRLKVAVSLVEMLLNSGADVNIQLPTLSQSSSHQYSTEMGNGGTALHLLVGAAANFGPFEIDSNYREMIGSSGDVATSSFVHICQLLLDHGRPENVRIRQGIPKAVDFSKNSNLSLTPLELLILLSDRFLLNTDSTESVTWQPIPIGTETYISIARLLLKHGSTINKHWTQRLFKSLEHNMAISVDEIKNKYFGEFEQQLNVEDGMGTENENTYLFLKRGKTGGWLRFRELETWNSLREGIIWKQVVDPWNHVSCNI